MGLIIGGFITPPEITPLEDGLKDEEAKTALPHLKDAQKKKRVTKAASTSPPAGQKRM